MNSHPKNFKPGLLIIDMQNDFCPPDGSLAVAEGRSIVPLINNLLTLPAFVSRVATKDFHPSNHISFASNHAAPNNVPFTSFVTITNPHNPSESYETRLWPDHCVQGTQGAELVDGLDPSKKINTVIHKGTDKRVEMYSAFYDPFTSPRISDSGISTLLKDSGVNWVYVVGLALDYCVRASALDARKEGFDVVLIREGTKAVDGSEENVLKVEEELRQAGIRVVDMASPEVQWLSANV
ncbi:Isochorismatase hydrolase [Guyanagaster necrorhizus]|uniref:nicotinamidase n=1 Tax=Guyanagaster necrorhizus TaxID=856835 RepID=A0A9P7W1P5_9AGAR|nr:Isochorismatase hydrolase [Guyanagaster necrorhizus MCA 3950]KAG7450760.1 Isochorismatase hydrolase [Guyanagaster necrorhizus MCA 3950]